MVSKIEKNNYKITIIGYDFFSTTSAISNRLVSFARVLADYNLQLITSKCKSANVNINFSKVHKVFFNPQNNKLPFILRLILDICYGLYLFCYLFIFRSDLYIVSSPPFFSNFLVCFALKLTKQKYILDIRDLYPKVFIENSLIKKDSTLSKIGNFIEKFMYDEANYITTTTKAMQSHIKNITTTKVEVIRNGFDGDTEIIREYKKITNFVFLGTLAKYTDVDLMIKVFRELKIQRKEINFSIIGSGVEDRILNSIDFDCEIISHLPHNKIKEFLKNTDIGVCFLKNNSLTKDIIPVKIYEYLGLELIPILNISGESSNLIKEYEVGVVLESSEYKSLSEQILKFLDDEELQENILNNIKKYKGLFSRDSETKKILKIIQDFS